MITTPEAYVHLSEDQKTLTFYYDTLRADRDGTKWRIRGTKDDYGNLAWTANFESPNTIVLTAIFDASFRDFRPTTTAGWFTYLQSLKSIEGFEHLNTSQVTDMSRMFEGCESLTALDLSNFDTSKVTVMNRMFAGCESLTALDLSSFNTAKVTDMSWMFNGCDSLTALDISSFNTAKVTDMSCMFADCQSLTALNLSNFDTAKVTDMNGMFWGCKSLMALDLSNFDTAKVTRKSRMFWGCRSLTALDPVEFRKFLVEEYKGDVL